MLEEKIEKMEERIEQVAKVLQRSSETKMHNKVNELQEDLCTKKFDLLVAQIHLSAVRSQLQLFEYNFRPAGAFCGPDASGQVAGGADLLTLSPGSAGPGALMEGGASAAGLLANGSSGSGGAGQLGAGAQQQPLAADQIGLGARRSPSTTSSFAASLGYRHKWIKAFKSLKETPSSSSSPSQTK